MDDPILKGGTLQERTDELWRWTLHRLLAHGGVAIDRVLKIADDQGGVDLLSLGFLLCGGRARIGEDGGRRYLYLLPPGPVTGLSPDPVPGLAERISRAELKEAIELEERRREAGAAAGRCDGIDTPF